MTLALGLLGALGVLAAACASPALSGPEVSTVPITVSIASHTPSPAAGSAVAVTEAAPGATPSPPRLPTSGATITPRLTAAPSRTPATPCTSQACASAAEHLWLQRPIASEAGLVNYVDRSYPYGSTQAGQREPHHGVEFFNPAGTPILAAGAGTVTVAGNDTSVAYGPTTRFYGNLVIVQLDQTFDGESVYTLYGHMQSVAVAVGDHVQPGDALGTVGSTGVAIGPHLHFEVRVGDSDYAATRNPELWLAPLPYAGQPLGVIAGRVTDTRGNLLTEVTVVIRPIAVNAEAPRARYPQTYAGDPLLSSDGRLQENFAIGDLPLGRYSVSVNTTRLYRQTVSVKPGEITWVAFVVIPPLPTPPVTAETTPPATQSPTPNGGGETATPADGDMTPTPAQNDVTPTPAEGEATPTPVMGGASAAPVDGGVTAASVA